MSVDIERAAEALDQHDCAGLCRGFRIAGFLSEMGGNGAIDNIEHLPHDYGLTLTAHRGTQSTT